MKKNISTFIYFITMTVFSQYQFEVSNEYPYGKYNPKAPVQVQDFKELIGTCNCTSESRKSDGTWSVPTKMIWKWKYIMNGTAVQDETLKEDGGHSGSIRQFNKDSLKWYVHYYNSKVVSTKLSTWSGVKKENGNIVLYMKQNAPNGIEGFSRLTFFEINKNGYKWIGEWVDLQEKIEYPFWKITCKRKEE